MQNLNFRLPWEEKIKIRLLDNLGYKIPLTTNERAEISNYL